MAKRISVTNQSDSGRNTGFHDNYTGKNMTRPQFVKEIKSGNYDNYAVRKQNGLDTPMAKPDGSKNNNLG